MEQRVWEHLGIKDQDDFVEVTALLLKLERQLAERKADIEDYSITNCRLKDELTACKVDAKNSIREQGKTIMKLTKERNAFVLYSDGAHQGQRPRHLRGRHCVLTPGRAHGKTARRHVGLVHRKEA